jgi:hypothetical protein
VREKEWIKGQLLSASYRFSLLTRVILKDNEGTVLWLARDALVHSRPLRPSAPARKRWAVGQIEVGKQLYVTAPSPSRTPISGKKNPRSLARVANAVRRGPASSLRRALTVTEFMNDILPGNGVELPGVHIVISKDKAAKLGIVMTGHPSVSTGIDRLLGFLKRGMEFESSIGIDAHFFDCEKLRAR